ncbi:MAG TPA: nuclear transport factor 2 family protein [Thermoanaerobaculia bacterium]
MTNAETQAALTRFYEAFARRDGESMAAMYAVDATFEDPVFRLTGPDIGKMWVSLTRSAVDFSVQFTVAKAGSGAGVVEWTARYLFGGKRPVVNVIVSEIEMRDGLIVQQKDTFDFPRWAAQALGLPGVLFGRFEFLRRSVSRSAAARLGLPPKP